MNTSAKATGKKAEMLEQFMTCNMNWDGNVHCKTKISDLYLEFWGGPAGWTLGIGWGHQQYFFCIFVKALPLSVCALVVWIFSSSYILLFKWLSKHRRAFPVSSSMVFVQQGGLQHFLFPGLCHHFTDSRQVLLITTKLSKMLWM